MLLRLLFTLSVKALFTKSAHESFHFLKTRKDTQVLEIVLKSHGTSLRS